MKKKDVNGKRILSAILCAALVIGMTGCGTKAASNAEEVLTQKNSDAKRTTITVLVKYAFTINGFEKAVEEKFPDIDIVQVGNYTRDMGIAEYESRLINDDLTDIVMTWPLDVGEEYWESRLLDLSGMDFTAHYNLSMLNDISKDGKLYYLPGPSQVRGIVYNKTLFEENGWQVPKDYEGFIELCKTIEASGMRSLQLGFKNEEVLNTAFVGYNYGNYFSKPKDTQWLNEYNKGEGSFGDHFLGALDVFQRMVDEGIWKESDLNVDYSDREKLFFNRECAMVEDSVLMTRMGYTQTGSNDEFALMPFFNPGPEGDWARLYMVCYIGLNKHLAESANKDKYELVKKLMEYISTEEGQKALSADTGAMFSSLADVEPPNISETQDLLTALQHGRYAIFPTLKNSQTALQEGLAGMIRGDTTKESVIESVDDQNSNPPVQDKQEVLGSADKDFSLIETGNFVTDAMREAAGSDIALFMDNGKDGRYNGKGISARLYKGDVTSLDVGRILPDLKSGDTGTLCKVTMSGEDLIQTLEHSIPVNNNLTGWFYYFSGLRMSYDPVAAPGKRIQKITTADKKEIDPKKIYSVAIMNDTVQKEFLQSCEETDITITSIIEDTIRKSESISPSEGGRFDVIH